MMLRERSQTFDFRTIVFAFSHYAVYMFVFLLTELVFYGRSGVVLGSAYVARVYSAALLFTAFGYLLFAFVRTRHGAKKPFAFFTLFYCAALVAASQADTPALYLSSAFAAMLSLGWLGGAAHYALAVRIRHGSCGARIVGFALATAICAQYAVQNLVQGAASDVAGLVLGALLLLVLELRSPSAAAERFPAVSPQRGRAIQKECWGLVVLVVLIALIVGFKDGIVTVLHAHGEIDVSGHPRLFYALGLVIAGYVGDISRRRYLGIATAVTLIFSTTATFLLGNPTTYVPALSVFYLYIGFYAVFMTVSFLDLAPETANPFLWAGMGRITRSLAGALTAAPAAYFFPLWGNTALLTVTTLLTMAAIAVFFWTGKFKTEESQNAVFYDESVFAAEKSFTIRETEIFCKLLASDHNLKEIAAELFISERVLQRHLTSMYEKTGTSSRAALLRVYYEAKNAAEKFED